jgi:CubicO group peptidase (beta-lactamase class C family)
MCENRQVVQRRRRYDKSYARDVRRTTIAAGGADRRPGAVMSLLLLMLLALAAPARAADAACAAPAILDDGWQAVDIEASGFDAAALCAVLGRVAGGTSNIHGIVVERRGRLVTELYRRGKDRSIWSLFTRETDFAPTVLHDLRSVSKSVVGLLVGMARGQGKIDVAASPLAYYPRYADLRSPERDAITLEHLLTMSSGLEWNESITSYGTLANDETRLYWDWKPYRYVLSRPIVAKPGTQFNYNGGGTAVLADIVVRVTGTPLRDFARTALFEPLGIREWEWVADPWRRPLAFAGLRMRPRDLAKIGRLMLARGEWQGRQVVPADWVAESLRPHIATGDGLGYGYQWWTGAVDWEGKSLAWSAAFGNGGQRLFVVPELDLTVVITAGAYNDPQIRRTVTEIFRQIVAAARS